MFFAEWTTSEEIPWGLFCLAGSRDDASKESRYDHESKKTGGKPAAFFGIKEKRPRKENIRSKFINSSNHSSGNGEIYPNHKGGGGYHRAQHTFFSTKMPRLSLKRACTGVR